MNAAQARQALAQAIAQELDQALPPAVASMAAALAAQGGETTSAVLFYGSVLRSGALDGVLDFYVLVDRLRDWHRGGFAAAANALLPPNIVWFEHLHEGQRLRAKVAVLRGDQFRRRMQAGSLDTTMWARYSQPAALVWARDAAARELAVDCVAQAVATATSWAARLGPEQGSAERYWQALYESTYSVELRAEKSGRAAALTGFDAARYARLLPLGWQTQGIDYERSADGSLKPRISPTQRHRARWGWLLRRQLGKPLNFARLVKSAYTLQGAVDYAIWKIERHSGVKLELTPWQRRHPVLASPLLLWRLKRRGAIR